MPLAPKQSLLTAESWGTSDPLLFCFPVSSELGLPARSPCGSVTRPKNGCSFNLPTLHKEFLNILTSGSCSDFVVDVRGLFCCYLKHLKCLQLICHIHRALLPLIVRLQGYQGFISRCSFALLQCFLGRVRETFFRSSKHLLPLSCKNLSTSLTRGMEISLEAVACTCVL